ncbi:hypothetical protein D9M71_719060 [compost metagenome]
MKQISGISVTGPAMASHQPCELSQKSAWLLAAVGFSHSQPRATGSSIQVSTARPGSAATGACLRISP